MVKNPNCQEANSWLYTKHYREATAREEDKYMGDFERLRNPC